MGKNSKGFDDPQAAWNTNRKDVEYYVYYVIRVCAGMVTPILRSGFGTRAQSPYIFTLFLLLFLAAEEKTPATLNIFVPAWLFFVALRAATTDKRQHTEYRGWPWLACSIPFFRTYKKGRFIEPWLVFGFALWLRQHDLGAATILTIAAIALFFEFVIDGWMIAKRERIVHNAKVDAEVWARINRGEGGW